ncbi:MAG TPA: thiamine phosphate synthase [Synergistales bacterium]|nr:thiamine phosphate synthase [Synergistales bacterium]
MRTLADRLRLYVIPDPAQGYGRPMAEQARLALEGGAGAIQLRHKEASSRDLYEEALEFRKLCRLHGALFIVNDRLDIALAAGADGVHLGAEDLPVAVVRRLAPKDFIIGATARTPEAAVEAEKTSADYLGVGAVFPTRSKKDTRVIGPEGLRKVVQAVSLPCVAIGGITVEGVPEILRTGASGVAVIGAVAGASDIRAATMNFMRKLHVT